jgi:hypothetical protein
VDPRVQVEVSVWLPPGADAERALALVAEAESVEAGVAEVDKERIRLSARTWADSARERGAVGARLRREWLRRLREEGLSSTAAA